MDLGPRLGFLSPLSPGGFFSRLNHPALQELGSSLKGGLPNFQVVDFLRGEPRSRNISASGDQIVEALGTPSTAGGLDLERWLAFSDSQMSFWLIADIANEGMQLADGSVNFVQLCVNPRREQFGLHMFLCGV